jgi:hypothetical protein
MGWIGLSVEPNRRDVLKVLGAASLLTPLALAGCTSSASTASSSSSSGTAAATTSGSGGATGALALDATQWQYDSANDVYYQIGKSFLTHAAAPDIEKVAVYVPGKYLTATKNSSGTYTAKVNTSGKVAGFTAATAPIVLPVNTPGYAGQAAVTSYNFSDVSAYLKAGFVYVAPGLRGQDTETSSYTGNAPWGVTDLKAAVRWVRYNAGSLPGHTDRIFVFGMSGGGAQSAVMGASGDSPLYEPYLTAIGAAMQDAFGQKISDAIAGAMAWCPVTSLDYANAAYEWNMGQFASTGTRAAGTWTKAYSGDLADAFAAYLNKLRLKDSDGRVLQLTPSASGHYLAGSYYDHVVAVVQQSLNDFLAVTKFPYTAPAAGPMGGRGGPGAPDGPGGTPPAGGPPAGMSPPPTGAGGAAGGTTYQTVQAYIDHLNSASTWVKYDAATKKATVLSLAGFVQSQKNASKDVGAFDGVGRTATENRVLGIGSAGLHFAPVSRDTIQRNAAEYSKLSGWQSAYAATAYTTDFAKKDAVGVDVLTRLNMYNPMYFLSPYYSGYTKSTVAPHWRIRTGIMQGDTASTVEVNLALALAGAGVRNVDFATVWGQAHVEAELTGSPATNFIDWVTKSVG